LVKGKLNKTYKCEICGQEVVVTKEGGGVLVCCGKPMREL
jgi:superoxide reductase